MIMRHRRYLVVVLVTGSWAALSLWSMHAAWTGIQPAQPQPEHNNHRHDGLRMLVTQCVNRTLLKATSGHRGWPSTSILPIGSVSTTNIIVLPPPSVSEGSTVLHHGLIVQGQDAVKGGGGGERQPVVHHDCPHQLHNRSVADGSGLLLSKSGW